MGTPDDFLRVQSSSNVFVHRRRTISLASISGDRFFVFDIPVPFFFFLSLSLSLFLSPILHGGKRLLQKKKINRVTRIEQRSLYLGECISIEANAIISL